jgi:ferredoxin
VAEPLQGSEVSVDRELCMGTGMCIVYAPLTFAHDAEAKAVVLEPLGDALSDIRGAVEACPMGALSLHPRDGR